MVDCEGERFFSAVAENVDAFSADENVGAAIAFMLCSNLGLWVCGQLLRHRATCFQASVLSCIVYPHPFKSFLIVTQGPILLRSLSSANQSRFADGGHLLEPSIPSASVLCLWLGLASTRASRDNRQEIDRRRRCQISSSSSSSAHASSSGRPALRFLAFSSTPADAFITTLSDAGMSWRSLRSLWSWRSLRSL